MAEVEEIGNMEQKICFCDVESSILGGNSRSFTR